LMIGNSETNHLGAQGTFVRVDCDNSERGVGSQTYLGAGKGVSLYVSIYISIDVFAPDHAAPHIVEHASPDGVFRLLSIYIYLHHISVSTCIYIYMYRTGPCSTTYRRACSPGGLLSSNASPSLSLYIYIYIYIYIEHVKDRGGLDAQVFFSDVLCRALEPSHLTDTALHRRFRHCNSHCFHCLLAPQSCVSYGYSPVCLVRVCGSHMRIVY